MLIRFVVNWILCWNPVNHGLEKGYSLLREFRDRYYGACIFVKKICGELNFLCLNLVNPGFEKAIRYLENLEIAPTELGFLFKAFVVNWISCLNSVNIGSSICCLKIAPTELGFLFKAFMVNWIFMLESYISRYF